MYHQRIPEISRPKIINTDCHQENRFVNLYLKHPNSEMAETQMTAQIGLLTIYCDCWDATYGRFTRRKNRHKNCHQSDPGDYLITQSVSPKLSPNIKFAKIQYLINPDTQKFLMKVSIQYTPAPLSPAMATAISPANSQRRAHPHNWNWFSTDWTLIRTHCHIQTGDGCLSDKSQIHTGNTRALNHLTDSAGLPKSSLGMIPQ